MSTIASSTTSGSTLTAFFDSRSDAQDAVDRLVDAGIPSTNIRLVPGNENATSSTTTTATHEHKGFLESLADFFMPEEDRYSYAEGLRRGGYLVTVSNLSSSLYDSALDILDDEGAVDLDQREQQWKGEGWNGYQASDAWETDTTSQTRTAAAADTSLSGTSSSRDFTAASATTDDGVIPVVQEELKIGKRDVNLGRVRVRSYVVEEPVNEQVSLSQERVVLERRPVDRALNPGDAAFTERSIEAEEHAEEAVVAKTARVTEEVGLRKEREQRQQTVSDTVRHTEVEVEDERTTEQRSTGTAGFGSDTTRNR